LLHKEDRKKNLLMRPSLCLCVFVSLCFTPATHAEVIDRIVAVVEGHIITASDLRQERETRALLGDKPTGDDRTLARELVDNHLIELALADYPNIDVADAEVDADLARFNRRDGLFSAALREAVRRRIRMQKFFDLRFRQSIRPADDEMRKYYEDVFVPEARKRGLQSIPPLTDPEMASAIRENVIQESLNEILEVWLEAIRRRSKVEVFQ
jgi:parvulin-like peptidyl-prolyl isomerase